MNIQQIRETVRKHGFQMAAQDIACRAANRVAQVSLLHGVSLDMETVDPKFLADDAGLEWGFLDRATLERALANGGAEGMDAAFVGGALAKGDRCYGALVGETVVSYGWYSSRPTAVTAIDDDAILCFDAAYAYMYRGYTLPAYRGKRLHGIGMARAMKALVDEGQKGLVSCVEAGNFASLASCQRLGYKVFGQLLCVKRKGRFVSLATRGCKAYGMRIVLGGSWTGPEAETAGQDTETTGPQRPPREAQSA